MGADFLEWRIQKLGECNKRLVFLRADTAVSSFFAGGMTPFSLLMTIFPIGLVAMALCSLLVTGVFLRGRGALFCGEQDGCFSVIAYYWQKLCCADSSARGFSTQKRGKRGNSPFSVFLHVYMTKLREFCRCILRRRFPHRP